MIPSDAHEREFEAIPSERRVNILASSSASLSTGFITLACVVIMMITL